MFVVETRVSCEGSIFRGVFSSLDLAVAHAEKLIENADDIWADAVDIYEGEIDNPTPIERWSDKQTWRRVWWRFIDGTGGEDLI